LVESLTRSSIEDVIASGKKHGVTRDDIIGCLHFHVKDQFIEFAKRLKRFNIDVHFFDREPLQLGKDIQQKRVALGPFDRIFVSNLVDHGNAGVQPILSDWGPLLNPKNHHSTLIGSFTNWASNQHQQVPHSFDTETDSSVLIARVHTRPYPVSVWCLVLGRQANLVC
jgi:hypothetical protein